MKHEKLRVTKLASVVATLIVVAQLILVIVSWVIAAAMPETTIHSLLSSEGIRWFFNTLTDNLLTPLLAWILLAGMAYGSLKESGILSARHALTSRQHFALRFVLLEAIVFVIILLLLTTVPNAILLSVTGKLFPSSFSDGLVPILSLMTIVLCSTYSLLSNSHKHLSDIFQALVTGICKFSPFILVYLLAAELYYSLRFVIG